MNTITTTLVTEAAYSEDGLNRYALKKTWEEGKPRLAVIMLAPSEASAVSLDNTSMLVLNNCGSSWLWGCDDPEPLCNGK